MKPSVCVYVCVAACRLSILIVLFRCSVQEGGTKKPRLEGGEKQNNEKKFFFFGVFFLPSAI